MSQPLHIVHLLYRFAAGGLENVIVQLINGLPHDDFRHTVVALTDADLDFSSRIERKGVDIICLNKQPGQPFSLYPKMYRLLSKLRPDVLHTCNIAALEFAPVAWAVGVPLRVHAEHGWDIADPDGSNQHYRRLRRLYRAFVHKFVAVSPQLFSYLRDLIAVPPEHLYLLPNGVDTQRFRPSEPGDLPPSDFPFDPSAHRIIGSVGRFEPIKNPGLLVDAFIALAREAGQEQLRLVMIGDGPLRQVMLSRLMEAGLSTRAWLPGSRTDIPQLLRSFTCFVLPSLAEGTSCTLQEAMASASCIIATDVGGSANLLGFGQYGTLIASEDFPALCQAIRDSFTPEMQAKGLAGRLHVESEYGLQNMLNNYQTLFKG